jgi:thiol-disulfide isomerase/thioredoxin
MAKIFPRHPILFTLLGAALLALGACKPADAADRALPVVAKAPAWKLMDLAGREVGAASLQGKVVVVDFWATWCGPCVGEIPSYIALQKKYGANGLVIVGLSVDEGGPAVVKEFAAKKGMNYPVAMADEATIAAFGSFEAIPTTFLIDRHGNIRHQKTGAMEAGEYEKLVRSLLD